MAADAKTLLDQWVETQNKADFEGYKALYAENLSGLKRVGSRTYRMNRTQWLADREKLFTLAVSVTIKEPKITVMGHTAAINFEQTWKSPHFSDVGQKRLVLVQEGNGLLITGEEMLTSEVDKAASQSPGVASVSALKRAGGRLFAVLDRGEFSNIVTGPAQFLDWTASLRAVSEELTPEKAKAVHTGSFTLLSPSGTSCETTVKGVHVLANVFPHFGELQRWRGELGEPAAEREKIAADLWRMAGDAGRFLVAELENKAECNTAIFGRPTTSTAPAPLTSKEADSGTAAVALAAFRKLPAYQAIQAQFIKEGKRGTWENYADAKPRVTLFQNADGAYVAVSAAAGEGCADFYGETWAIWQLGDKLRLLTDPTYPGELFTPTLAVDVNSDGIPEFMSDSRLFGTVGNVLRAFLDMRSPDYDCHC